MTFCSLRPLVREHTVALLDLLFVAAAQTIVALGLDPKRLDALTGMTAVVHTWGRNLTFHPHLHCIIPGGGLAAHDDDTPIATAGSHCS